MVKKVAVAVLLLAMMTVAIVQAMEQEEKPDNLPGLKIGGKAPDFELKNLAGETVKLSDFQGKKVLLNFWATWCPPCKEEMPDMEKFYQSAGEDVVILAVNIDPQYNVSKFISEMGLTFPILLDEKDEVNSLYQVLTIPTTYFIDEEGIIRHKYISAMTEEIMKQYVEDM
ncbi:peroxiredoxin family protein [Niallia endozanthoxylica]|uniref:TlpA family protein disulfide reductase n=1 Tax=Niallia endozanthoxylica TaxID=2036016 RepID=A0A5J5HPC4_9BACI|nr:TlpA disulfide reductase family protein [Niallia endozanthoxylica]KAA9023584.1 TlpA family protein disulfide reductase [Niallia endozanthoxylica]